MTLVEVLSSCRSSGVNSIPLIDRFGAHLLPAAYDVLIPTEGVKAQGIMKMAALVGLVAITPWQGTLSVDGRVWHAGP